MNDVWYSGVVQEGIKKGQQLGFPTVNLDPSILLSGTKHGVYASVVKYKNTLYAGALYLGPRLVFGETKTILEIHILNFAKTIYGKTIDFTLKDFIRVPLQFDSLEALKEQLVYDVAKCESCLPIVSL